MTHIHRTMKPMTAMIAACLAAGALLLAAPRAQGQAPAILDQVPAEAELFIAIPSLQGLADRLAMLNQAAGLDQPELEDALTQLKLMLGMNQGIDDDRGAALILLTLPIPAPDGPDDDPSGIVLIPVEDYEAFLANFDESEDAGDGIHEVHIGGIDERAFVKEANGYAALSDRRENVAAYEPGGNGFADRAGELGGPVLSDSDALIYFDLAKLGPKLRPLVERMAEEGRAEIRNNPFMDEQDAALGEGFLALYAGAADAVLRDGQAALLGLDAGGDGVGFTQAIQFKADSPLAGQFASGPDRPLALDRLADDPFLLASTLDTSALPINEWIDALVEAMPEDHPMTAMLRDSLAMVRLSDRQQQAWYAPPAGMASFFNTVTFYSADDPDALIREHRQMIEEMDRLELAEGVAYTTTYEEGVMEVEGRAVDQYNIRFNLPPEQMMELGPMAMFLGEGVGGYVTAAEGGVIVTTSADPIMLNKAVAAARDDGGDRLEGEQRIDAARQKLPDHRAMEVYVGVGSILEMAGTFMAMFMPDAQFQVPPDLEPVAISASVHGGGLAQRLYVPTDVIVAVRTVVEAFTAPGGPGGPRIGEAPGEAR